MVETMSRFRGERFEPDFDRADIPKARRTKKALAASDVSLRYKPIVVVH